MFVSTHRLHCIAHYSGGGGGGGNVFDDAHELVRVTPLPFALPRPAGRDYETIRVWDVNTQKEISTISSLISCRAAAFDGSGRYIAFGKA